jgi:hypothetical protein
MARRSPKIAYLIPDQIEKLSIMAASAGLSESLWFGRTIDQAWTNTYLNVSPAEIREVMDPARKVRIAGGGKVRRDFSR